LHGGRGELTIALLLTGVFCSSAGFIGGKLFGIRWNYTLAFEINMLVAARGILALLFATMPAPSEVSREASNARE
jgi:hypothetical protein